jgi:hypothetical protein
MAAAVDSEHRLVTSVWPDIQVCWLKCSSAAERWAACGNTHTYAHLRPRLSIPDSFGNTPAAAHCRAGQPHREVAAKALSILDDGRVPSQ